MPWPTRPAATAAIRTTSNLTMATSRFVPCTAPMATTEQLGQSADMTDTGSVRYAREPGLDVGAFRRVLDESGLGAIRPLDDALRLQQMLDQADLVVTARRSGDGDLLGVARSITDFSWCCYLSELAVSKSAQGLGIGRGLLAETRRLVGPTVSVILGAVPQSVGFYEKIGMPRMPDAFWYRREH